MVSKWGEDSWRRRGGCVAPTSDPEESIHSLSKGERRARRRLLRRLAVPRATRTTPSGRRADVAAHPTATTAATHDCGWFEFFKQSNACASCLTTQLRGSSRRTNTDTRGESSSGLYALLGREYIQVASPVAMPPPIAWPQSVGNPEPYECSGLSLCPGGGIPSPPGLSMVVMASPAHDQCACTG